MVKSDNEPIILEKLDNEDVSYRTLKEKCHGSDIRKIIHTLLKANKIKISGYDTNFQIKVKDSIKKSKHFQMDYIIFSKADSETKNPIYVKSLLDNPLENENYFKIRKIFKNRIKEVNNTYNNELEELAEIQGEISLKEAINSKQIESNAIYRRIGNAKRGEQRKDQKFGEILKKHPEAQIYYLEKKFVSKLFNLNMPYKVEFPYFGRKIGFFSNSTRNINSKKKHWHDASYVKSYKNILDHLPISSWAEEQLFHHFVINALREEGKDREKRLWNLATTLTSLDLRLFAEKLRVIEMIYDDKIDYLNSHSVSW